MPSTLRSVAKACGVSTATVSRALAGHQYVRQELREQIQKTAHRLGYAPNPLVGTLMAHVRRARAHNFLGNLAIVHVPSIQNLRIGLQEKRVLDSACIRAKELGFAMEIYELKPGPRGEAMLARVLSARGISGVVFVYPEPSDAPTNFPWDEFSVVAIDLARQEPLLNTVCHDHYASLTIALSHLRAAGYQRVGLFIEHYKDARTNYKWSAAFRSFQTHQQGIDTLPVLMEEKMTEKAFIQWYRAHRPDLVIGHFDDCIRWLDRVGQRVPEDAGFFGLNYLSCTRPSAGIDPQLELQGQIAADTLIAEVQRGQRGLPIPPRQILIPGRFVPGPSIKERPASA
jgi:LacI family transcriptional regulator